MYRSAASVGTARIAPDIIVRMPSRALRVLRIVLSVRFGSARGVAQGLPDRTRHTRFEGSLSALVGRHGAMNPAGRVLCNIMPIVKDYSRESQSFSIADLRRAPIFPSLKSTV